MTKCVDEAHVIAYQYRWTFVGNVFQATFAYPVHRMDQQPHDEPHEKLRHHAVDVKRDSGVQDAADQEKLRNAHAIA